MRIHLVTYATPRFRLRQLVLGWSARLSHVADTVTSWTPEMLRDAGLENRCKDIKLSERGSGFWAWKPFIIDAKLRAVPDGDLVFYCDVGRRFPYKILEQSLTPFLQWMKQNGQDFLPGLSISWRGPLSVWCKRDAFTLTEMDTPDAHAAASVQASFSLWRGGSASRDFVDQWLDMCSNRQLISDDPGICGHPEFPEFHEHRHDQSLLTLCCLKNSTRALEMGGQPAPIDTRDPSQVLFFLYRTPPHNASLPWKFLKVMIRIMESLEKFLRRFLKFNHDLTDHPLAID